MQKSLGTFVILILQELSYSVEGLSTVENIFQSTANLF